MSKNSSTKLAQRWVCDICKTAAFSTFEEATVHESTCQAAASDTTKNTPKKPVGKRKPAKQHGGHAAKRKFQRQSNIIDLVSPPSASNTKLTETTSHEPIVTPMDVSASQSNESTVWKTLLSGSQGKAALAEQRTADFRAQRRLKAEQERERQRKRQLANQSKKSDTIIQLGTSTVSSAHVGATKEALRRKKGMILEERFPKSNHVLPSDVSQSLPLTKAATIPLSWPTHPVTVDDIASVPLSLPTPLAPTSQELLHRLWHQCWIPQRFFSSNLTHWVGTTLRHAIPDLTEWIQEWKETRQQALDRMQERQQRLLQKSNGKRKRRKNKDDDDDEWMWDGEDTDDEGLPSVCLLTGSTGKTALVHHVAQTTGCTILELNTSHDRGYTALKKAIGEATQSLSSKTLMEQQSSGDDASTGLTVILLDEVDNLFAPADNGFWTALSELAKRAKSPIFLTATEAPEELRSRHVKRIHLENPTPTECVSVMKAWNAETGAFCYRNDNNESLNDRLLERAAVLCNCDLRKLAQELELFSYAPLPCDPILGVFSDTKPSPDLIPATDADQPRVHSVAPRKVVTADYTLLTLSGTNFMALAGGTSSDEQGGYEVHVFIGDRRCPKSLILNDSTILSVSPPRGESPGHDRLRLSFSYAPIHVCGTEKCGILSTSENVCGAEPISQDLGLPFVYPPVFLEYHESATGQPTNNEDSDEEFEFTVEPSNDCARSGSEMAPCDMEEVDRILKEGILAWCSRNTIEERSAETCSPFDQAAEDVLNDLYDRKAAMSDTVFIEDFESMGLPCLSGTWRGFGFDLTEAYPNSTNEKTKRPNEDALFELHWKDNFAFFGGSDSLCTLPLNRRERNLLAASESRVRGLSLTKAADLLPADAKDESDSNFVVSSDVSDEDMFLPYRPPPCLRFLPSCLLASSETAVELHDAVDIHQRLWFEQHRSREKQCHWLDEFVFVSEKDTRFNALKYCPTESPLEKPRYNHVWLDYLPVLRRMARLDRAAAVSYESESSSRASGLSEVSNRRRTTRRSHNQGYRYYFESLVPPAMKYGADGAVETLVKDIAAYGLPKADSSTYLSQPNA